MVSLLQDRGPVPEGPGLAQVARPQDAAVVEHGACEHSRGRLYQVPGGSW